MPRAAEVHPDLSGATLLRLQQGPELGIRLDRAPVLPGPPSSPQAVGFRVIVSFGLSVSSFSASFRPRQRYRKPAGHRPSSE